MCDEDVPCDENMPCSEGESPFQLDDLIQMMTDPAKVAIWSEILRNPGITAKQLIKILKFKKTKMYYHLNALEDKKLVEVELVEINETMSQKHYKIHHYFDIVTRDRSFLENKPKIAILFTLNMVNTLVNIQIRRYSEMSSEEVQTRVEERKQAGTRSFPLGVIHLGKKRQEEFIQDFHEFIETKVRPKVDEDLTVEDIKEPLGSFFFGFTEPFSED